ncbi:sensor histidine kinase [Sphingomonas sp. Leaf25]|uniref:sensor histidine kinase n=1 Tax=Sphingomonas sp. Leaf25 TaxID=1735692 RepID=UPI0006F991E9|nr:histidine kinase dimerization/phosphoacceptor domain -containing protein [Sphingomonas sp. Leaf25]KQN06379.1 histidine kinase [Sphingomonas sp. Leaf25]
MATGAKLVLILSGALLPLALIALYATFQTARTADLDTRARLRVAATEASRAIAIELVGDMTALRVATNALALDPANTPGCARVEGVFAQQSTSGARFAIRGLDGRLVCGTDIPTPQRGKPDANGLRAQLGDKGLLVDIAGPGGRSRAVAFFPAAMLRDLAQPSGYAAPFSALLRQDGDGDGALPLETMPVESGFQRLERIDIPLGLDDLELAMVVRKAPITSSAIVAMLLPLVMWIAATGIGWLVVDRMLIRPLRRFRDDVGRYRPGEPLAPVDLGSIPAQEIADLGETFLELTRTVERHEQSMADGLVRQTKLTREVHHRVKNNLQVIASLINFHARSAHGEAASDAYATIQRRVDALAAVHRHHYAEMEENRGLELKAVVGELASNIRATAPDGSRSIGITLNVEPVLVTQDVAVAVSFLLTELIELAGSVNPQAPIGVSVRQVADSDTALLRAVSPALVESDALETLVKQRYGRIILGLSRQLRAPLHHDPLTGAYEITIAAKPG